MTDPSPAQRVRKQCKEEDCQKVVSGRGWCAMHYRRWKKHGDPRSPGTRAVFNNPADAIAARSKQNGECIEWTGWIDPGGYGQMSVNGKTSRPHRVAWELQHGPIPKGVHLDHICHNTKCLNVKHLRISTPSQNGANRDGLSTNNVSGHRGVSWSSQKRKWKAEVQRLGVRRSKLFPANKLDEAAKWADQMRQELFGEFAGRSN